MLGMQDNFKDTKFIIINEYSMVGRVMFATADLRCWDISVKNESFKNVSVVLVGDMRQLSLVFHSLLYVEGENLIQQSEKALLMPDSIGMLYCLKFFIKQAVKRLYLEKQYEDLVMKYL